MLKDISLLQDTVIGGFLIGAYGWLNQGDPLVVNYMFNAFLGCLTIMIYTRNFKDWFKIFFSGMLLAWLFTNPITVYYGMYFVKPTSAIAYVFGFMGLSIFKVAIYLKNNPQAFLEFVLKLKGKK